MKTWKEHAKTLAAGVLAAGVVVAGVNLADAATFFTGTSTAVAGQTASANAIDTSSREAVRARYLKDIVSASYAESPNNGADVANCRAGVANPTTARSVERALNFYRGLNGTNAVKFDQTSTLQDVTQQAALNMAANRRLEHGIEKDSKCYSDKAAYGAAASNLSSSKGQTPAEQILWYFMDYSGWEASTMNRQGSNDNVGHRTGLMNPALAVSSYGNVNGYNAIQVNANMPRNADVNNETLKDRNAPAPTVMTWPSKGYFPYTMLTANVTDPKDVERWSVMFNLNENPKIDLSQVKATVTAPNGQNVAVTVLPNYSSREDYAGMLIKLPQIKDLPQGQAGSRDYKVSVTGIKGASFSTYSYTVKLFDPMISTTRMAPQIKVYAAPRVVQGTPALPASIAVEGSEGIKYQWQRSFDAGRTWEDVNDQFKLPKNDRTWGGTAQELDYGPGVATEYANGLQRSKAITSRAEAENLRFRLRATNNVGTSISPALKLEYYGFDQDKVVREGNQLVAKMSLIGNSDSIDRVTDVIWRDENSGKVLGKGERLTITAQMKGMKVAPSVDLDISSFHSSSGCRIKLPAYSVG